jgi:hypothetical protein
MQYHFRPMATITILLFLAASAPGDAILGQWRGTSTCVKIDANRSCNDEIVQYTFTREGDVYKAKGDRLVDGEYAEMGRLDFHYDAAAKEWSCAFSGPRVHGIWSFTIDGDEMKGTDVLLPSKTVVRHVLAHRFHP